MSYARRSDDRRRRVLMSNGGMGHSATPTTRSFHRDVSPRPVVAYGKRARRPLRGRWFALVPTTRAALAQFTGAVLLATCALVTAHHLTLTMPTLGTRPAWVNVFQWDAPGSLGRFIQACFLGLSAAAAYLVYQLRRHRNDDFQGQYRLWRWMIALFLISAVTTIVPLIELIGGFLEWGIGRRVALSGADWVRLLASIGTFAVAIQSLLELRRHMSAMVWMLVGWIAVTTPVAMQWHGVEITTPLTATVASNAWLIGAAAWLIGTVWYLKCLVREVRCLPQQQGVFANWFAASDSEDDDEVVEATSKAKARREGTKAQPKPKVTPAKSERQEAKPVAKRVEDAAKEASDEDGGQTAEDEKPKRGWFGLRRRKSSEEVEQDDEMEVKASPNKPKQAAPKPVESEDEAKDEPKKRRFGLGRFLSRGDKEASAEDTDEQLNEDVRKQQTKPKVAAETNSLSDEDSIDPDSDEIDWASLSKAERRRLRKQLKRSGRAA